ncbi:MAG TPA: glycosyltransferase family 2 protein [Candidatus Sulfomarinibacteraceae bacterium]|nr:glycosyltransferase family 2 protein [Candidatus Sulfomarinibacteraceae bacterium]
MDTTLEADTNDDGAKIHDVVTDDIVAVIPAYQEANEVGRVVAQVQQHGLPVLVVDDGSTDDTASRARDAGATVLQQPSNRGKGASLRAGFRWALEREFAAILTLDADGQHDPREIPRFLEARAASAPDLLIGARDFNQMPWTRYTTNMVGRWTLSWVMGEEMRDNQSGYRLLSRRMARASLDSDETGYEFEVEMIVICKQRDYALAWVPIRTIYNGERSHINHLQHIYNYARLLWRVRQQIKAGEG